MEFGNMIYLSAPVVNAVFDAVERAGQSWAFAFVTSALPRHRQCL